MIFSADQEYQFLIPGEEQSLVEWAMHSGAKALMKRSKLSYFLLVRQRKCGKCGKDETLYRLMILMILINMMILIDRYIGLR